MAEPAAGSDGKLVYFPRYRPGGTFAFGFDLHNGGSLPVRLEGAVETDHEVHGLRVVGLALPARPNDATARDLIPFRPLTIAAHATRFIVVKLRMSCAGFSAGTSSTLSAVELRYSYALVFDRSQRVEPPAAVTLKC